MWVLTTQCSCRWCTQPAASTSGDHEQGGSKSAQLEAAAPLEEHCTERQPADMQPQADSGDQQPEDPGKRLEPAGKDPQATESVPAPAPPCPQDAPVALAPAAPPEALQPHAEAVSKTTTHPHPGSQHRAAQPRPPPVPAAKPQNTASAQPRPSQAASSPRHAGAGAQPRAAAGGTTRRQASPSRRFTFTGPPANHQAKKFDKADYSHSAYEQVCFFISGGNCSSTKGLGTYLGE